MLLTSVTWLLALGPAFVAMWRGCWGLLDLIVFPDQPLLSAAVCVFLSLLIGHPLVYLRLAVAEETVDRPWLAVTHRAVCELVSMLLWRGSWKLLDAALGLQTWSLAASAALGVAVLTLLRCLPTPANMPPMPQPVRTRLPHGLSPTLLGVETERRPAAAVVDALLSLAGVQALLVLVWRGAWNLLNQAMLPLGWREAPLALLVGAAGVLLCTRLPGCLSWVGSRAGSSSWRRLREDLVALLTTVFVVSYWKGVWGFLDMMAFPECQYVVYILLYVFGFKIIAVYGFCSVFSLGEVCFNEGSFDWLESVYQNMDEHEERMDGEEVDVLVEST